jgi:radical SAM protein with 4Fe4S-binding SPASM domain
MSGDPPGIGRFPIITTKHLPCSLGSFSLMVYAGNLSIVPCHRLAYPEYQGAKFITNDNGKLEIEATPFMNSYLSMYYYNNALSSNCQLCDYKHVCLKGCPGAQYEYFADATMQIPSVCDLFKVKYQTLLEYYHSIGLFHYLF